MEDFCRQKGADVEVIVAKIGLVVGRSPSFGEGKGVSSRFPH